MKIGLRGIEEEVKEEVRTFKRHCFFRVKCDTFSKV